VVPHAFLHTACCCAHQFPQRPTCLTCSAAAAASQEHALMTDSMRLTQPPAMLGIVAVALRCVRPTLYVWRWGDLSKVKWESFYYPSECTTWILNNAATTASTPIAAVFLRQFSRLSWAVGQYCCSYREFQLWCSGQQVLPACIV